MCQCPAEHFIQCYDSIVVVAGQLHRADPVYYTSREHGRGWHDLAMAKNPCGTATDVVPFQLLGFLRFDDLDGEFQIPKKYKCSNRKVEKGTELAVVHAFSSPPPDGPEQRQRSTSPTVSSSFCIKQEGRKVRSSLLFPHPGGRDSRTVHWSTGR